MTSSLVGSEMCIRDRIEGRLGTETRGTHRGHGLRHLVSQSWTRLGSRAVSYTHLTLPTICSV
eukprot:4170068-Prorocentrum_lima.AAC.1